MKWLHNHGLTQRIDLSYDRLDSLSDILECQFQLTPILTYTQKKQFSIFLVSVLMVRLHLQFTCYKFIREYLAYQELQARNVYLLEQVISFKTKYIFHNTNGQLKTGKMGTHLSADTSLVQCSWCNLTKPYLILSKQFRIPFPNSTQASNPDTC